MQRIVTAALLFGSVSAASLTVEIKVLSAGAVEPGWWRSRSR